MLDYSPSNTSQRNVKSKVKGEKKTTTTGRRKIRRKERRRVVRIVMLVSGIVFSDLFHDRRDYTFLRSDAIQKSRFYIERKKNSGHIVP